MPRIGPISRNDLIRYLRKYGFDGPYSGGKHQYMRKDNIALRVPNPHRGDIGIDLLHEILIEAGISRDQWEAL